MLQARGAERLDRRVDEGEMRLARERLKPREQLVPCGPMGEGMARRVLRRPEFGEIEPRHDRVLGNSVGAHVRKGELHSLRLLAGARAVAFGERQQDEAPMQEGRKRGRRRPRAHEFVENFARFRRATELQQSQSLLEAPVAQSDEIVRRLRALEKRQRLRRALLLEEVGGQIEARADGVRRARDRLLQEPLSRLRLPGDPHEGAQVGERGGMGRIGGERLAHRGLGVLDRALAIAREPVIDPGVGPARIQLNGRGESLLRARGLAERRPSLAIGVVRRRELRRAPAGFARRDKRGLMVAEREMRDGGVKERARDRLRATLAPPEARERLGVPPRGLERDAELKLGLRVARRRARRPGSRARSPPRCHSRGALRRRGETTGLATSPSLTLAIARRDEQRIDGRERH